MLSSETNNNSGDTRFGYTRISPGIEMQSAQENIQWKAETQSYEHEFGLQATQDDHAQSCS